MKIRGKKPGALSSRRMMGFTALDEGATAVTDRR